MLAVAAALPAAFLGSAWLSSGLSWWSKTFVLGCALTTIGALARALSIRRGTALLVAGGVLAVAPSCVRLVWVRDTASVAVIRLPQETSSALSRIYPESDGALVAATWIGWLGTLRDPEASRFSQILRDAYARTTPPAETLPTPAINTYLGRQDASAFDTIVIRPERTTEPEAGVIFLHGYSGNFYVYCWELAQAAASANLVTICPSMDGRGAWWTRRGQQVAEATLDYGKKLGLRRVYLAGLSNGAVGASALARIHEQRLAGLVLISGVGDQQPPEFPVLIVQGQADEMMTAKRARSYAAGHGNVRYHELQGGHLIVLSRHKEVRALIGAFLLELEQRTPER